MKTTVFCIAFVVIAWSIFFKYHPLNLPPEWSVSQGYWSQYYTYTEPHPENGQVTVIDQNGNKVTLYGSFVITQIR